VPGESCTSWTATGFVLGSIGAHRGIVGLLSLPGDDPVSDVALPRARTSAVHTVGGSHHLVMAPPVPVEDIARPTPLRKATRPSSDSSHLVKNRPSFNSASDALPLTPAGTGGFMI
jgi:hypothetical protein